MRVWPDLVVVLLLSSTAYADDRCASATAQSDLNECAGRSSHSADAELNDVYQEILRRYASDHVFVAALSEAQRAWVTFRDSEMAAAFPETDKGAYGSVFPMCSSGLAEELTRARTKRLRVWLDGVEEGDVCAGSIHVNN